MAKIKAPGTLKKVSGVFFKIATQLIKELEPDEVEIKKDAIVLRYKREF